jgi:signal transduction histidine kinase
MDSTSPIRTWIRIAIRMSSLVPVILALGVLILWMLGRPELGTFGPGQVPMAPSTALLLCLFGLAVFGTTHRPDHRGIRRTALWIILLGGSIALLLGILSALGIRLGGERLGFRVREVLPGIPLGHMSPLTAAAFLLAALSYLAAPGSLGRRFCSATVGLVLAVLLCGQALLLLLTYAWGVPLLYGSAYIPPALLTGLAFMALGLAILLKSLPHLALQQGRSKSEIREGLYYLGAFALVASVILGVSYAYFRNFEAEHLAVMERQLAAIADLKVSTLVEYRKERLGDAQLLASLPGFSGLVSQALGGTGNAQAETQIMNWMDQLRVHYAYEHILLVDDQLRPRLSSPRPGAGLDPGLRPGLSRVLGSGQVHFQDFYRGDQDGRPHLAVIVPIRESPSKRVVIGVLVLQIDPGVFLYPFLKRWPLPSQSAETLLVRREGDQAVFLNELRFGQAAPLTVRVSLDQSQLPAVRAALGREGLMVGRDYRDEPVHAALRQVPDAPWALVARMDTAEILAPMKARVWQLFALDLILLGALASGLGFLWRQQRVRGLQAKLAAEQALRKSEHKFRTLFESMEEGVALHELETDEKGRVFDYRILDVNPAYQRHTGLDERESKGLLGSELYGVEVPPFLEEYSAVALGGEPFVFETYFPPLEKHFRISVISPSPGQFATVFEDITERRHREEELKQKNAEMERFTYMISHDLKSPLVTVRTFLGYLEQDLEQGRADRAAKDMDFIRSATSKMGRLLEDLLEVSRVGRVVNPPVQAGLRDLLQNVLESMAGPLSNRGVEVRLPQTSIQLFGDRPRLEEVWQNLVENAVKYMGDQPSPRIELGFKTSEDGVHFFVQDNGMGIDPRFQGKIFDLFEKLDPASEGTGLGLALVKRIVELHEGRIWVESEGAGRGTCFWFTLPLALKPRKEGFRA